MVLIFCLVGFNSTINFEMGWDVLTNCFSGATTTAQVNRSCGRLPGGWSFNSLVDFSLYFCHILFFKRSQQSWWSILICRRERAMFFQWSTRSWLTTGSWRASGTPRRSSFTSASPSGSSKRMSSRLATKLRSLGSGSENLFCLWSTWAKDLTLVLFLSLSRCLTGLRSTVRFSCGRTLGSGETWPRVELTRRATRPSRASYR